MSKLLFLDGCVRGELSRTLALTQHFLERWQVKHPNWSVERTDLAALNLRPFSGAEVDRRGKQERTGDLDGPDFALARQFAAADRIVLSAPFWELSFPAVVKLYLEHVSAINVTFRYGEDGRPIGLCRAEKLLYVTTRGGYYDASEDECGWRQIRGLCGMFGIREPILLRAEGLDDIHNDSEHLLSLARAEADGLAEFF